MLTVGELAELLWQYNKTSPSNYSIDLDQDGSCILRAFVNYENDHQTELYFDSYNELAKFLKGDGSQ